ncbi:MAG TPA: hypothetical protein VJT67_10075 [Longimicrobiaceae bacterium]|nr:hypothetical protein [Longimicrobiaceae bacterium]
MLAELIRAEWDRRAAWVLLMLGLFLAIPLRYAMAASAGLDDVQLMAAEGFARLALLVVVVAAAAWGAQVWAPERKGRWVYALSLPVGRVRLFGLRYVAGLAWLALAVAVLAAASYAVAATAPLPRFIYAYPGPFTAWVAAVSWLAYTAGFVASARWEHPGRATLLVVLILYVLLPLTGFATSPWGWSWTSSPLSPFGIFSEVTYLLGR